MQWDNPISVKQRHDDKKRIRSISRSAFISAPSMSVIDQFFQNFDALSDDERKVAFYRFSALMESKSSSAAAASASVPASVVKSKQTHSGKSLSSDQQPFTRVFRTSFRSFARNLPPVVLLIDCCLG
jgi:hypothetical protein